MTHTRPMQEENLIFEKSKKGRIAYSFSHEIEHLKDYTNEIPEKEKREEFDGIPELYEPDIMRHYLRLSQWNYGVDTGFYPLGSCTMKYNPKINEYLSRIEGFTDLHPYFPEVYTQGALHIIFELQELLKEITGLDAVTLQPAAGAHGEFTGIKIIRKHLEKQGDPRNKILIPDTAHGTNPASCTMNDYRVVQLKSDKNGIISAQEVFKKMDEKVAGIMITNPNTLGKFESNIVEIAEIVHSKGGLVYLDGANLNAFMGIADVKKMGVDVMHINLHKTFSTPHGGGGPGAGPVAVTRELEPYLPVPRVIKEGDFYKLDYEYPHTIGRVKSFYGNFLVCLKAYAYILELGTEGIIEAAKHAVLNANYLLSLLKEHYHVPYEGRCMHEFVITDKIQAKKSGVKTIHIAKRLIDYGFHPPTIYFPLIVNGAMMIEPTETESKETLDKFAETLIAISKESEENPKEVKSAPHNAVRALLDEVRAARNPVLKWTTGKSKK